MWRNTMSYTKKSEVPEKPSKCLYCKNSSSPLLELKLQNKVQFIPTPVTGNSLVKK